MSEDNLYAVYEEALVSELLYTSGKNVDKVLEIVGVEDFRSPDLANIFSAIAELARESENISVTSVVERMRIMGTLNTIGGFVRVMEIAQSAPKYLLEETPTRYAKYVKELSLRYQLRGVVTEAAKDFADDAPESARDVMARLTDVLQTTQQSITSSATSAEASAAINDYMSLLNERSQEDRDGVQGIPTLLPTLDKYTSGFLPGQLVTVGAQTGVGKALDVKTPILTPSGWKALSDIHIGDTVPSRYGWATVTNETDIMWNHDCYKLTFSEVKALGAEFSEIIADAEHQWIVANPLNWNEELVVTTKEIVAMMEEGEPVHIYSGVPLPSVELPGGDLDDYPMVLLSASIPLDDRLKVLLSASDPAGGTMSYRMSPATVKLHRDLFQTMRTLGCVPVAVPHERGKVGLEFNLGGAPQFFTVEGVEKCESVPVKCIEVDSHDHSYLAGKAMIPTHNSVFAVMCAISAAKFGKSVLVCSLEMQQNEIMDRIVANLSGVPMNDLKSGAVVSNPEAYNRVIRAQEEISKMKIVIDTDENLSIDSLRAKATKVQQSENGLDFIIVDYLQLMTPPDQRIPRQEQVATLSRNMKLIAKAFNVPVMQLVQLNRKGSKDTDNDYLPSLNDIRESHGPAQDSDIIILMHRKSDATEDGEVIPPTMVILDKNRNGESKKTIMTHSRLAYSNLEEMRRSKTEVDTDELTEEELSEIEEF